MWVTLRAAFGMSVKCGLAQFDPICSVLTKLNPFVITGSTALYDGINAHNELKLYSPDSNTGRFTEQYLKDRAAMLSWKLGFGTRDTEPVGDTFVKPQGGTPFYFEDFASNAITTKMRIGGGDSVNAVMSRPLGDFKLLESQVANNLAWRAAA